MENVEYFNGDLFEVVDPSELKRPESYRLHDAARYDDWSKVRPEILDIKRTALRASPGFCRFAVS